MSPVTASGLFCRLVDTYMTRSMVPCSPATGTATLMMLGYFYAPYTANTVMARLTYLW